MKFRIYQSGKGDCVLITSADGNTNILADGGVFDTYEDFLAGSMAYLRGREQDLDVLYVSHVDRDHIGGVLRMLDNEVDWRVYEHRQAQGVTSAKKPAIKRPCNVASIWHNAFFEDASLNQPSIIHSLGQACSTLAASSDPRLLATAERFDFLASSVGDAIEVSRRIGASQLNIPLNPEFQGGFMLRTDPPRVLDVGPIRAHLLGPTATALEELRQEWNDWLEEKATYLQGILARHDRDADDLVSSSLDDVFTTLENRADSFALSGGAVTPPNLASLTFLFQEGEQRAVFTGDADWEDVISGLEAHGLMDADGNCHVNVLKIPHHGAHNSYDDSFARRLTADHYVFCGNGKHHNPEPDVVDGYIRARRGTAAERTTNDVANSRSFKFWFNCSDEVALEDYTQFWTDMESRVRTAARASGSPRMHYRFLTSKAMTLTL